MMSKNPFASQQQHSNAENNSSSHTTSSVNNTTYRYSKQTHIQYSCLPHSTGISPNSYLSLAIRSFHCNTSDFFDHDGNNQNNIINSFLTKQEEQTDIGNDHNILCRMLEKSLIPSSSNKMLSHRNGIQFRILATVHGLGGLPLHGNPLSSNLSSNLRSTSIEKDHHDNDTKDLSPSAIVYPTLSSAFSCSWDSPSNFTTSSTNCENNKLLFPIRYKELPPDAYIQLKILDHADNILSTEKLNLWDDKLRLRMGFQRLRIRPDNPNSSNYEHIEDGKDYDEDTEEDEKWSASLILDRLDQMEKSFPSSIESKNPQTNKNIIGDNTSTTNPRNELQVAAPSESELIQNNAFDSIESIPWLDQLTRQRCMDIIQTNDDSIEVEGQISYGQHFLSYHPRLKQKAYLIVELPSCPLPIVHQETLYPYGLYGASGSVTALDMSHYYHEREYLQRIANRNTTNNPSIDNNDIILDPEPTSSSQKTNLDSIFIPMPNTIHFPPNSLQEDENDVYADSLGLVQLLDHESQDDNPVEVKYRTLQHELLRGLVDPALKPDFMERNRLNAIISSTSQHLTTEEKDLLWRFRFSLVDNRLALTKFLLSVDWTVENEVVQAAELLDQWRKRSAIEVTDALKLLGKNVAFQTSLVRSYAIDTLTVAPDEELVIYLLQLVQALKYENMTNDIISMDGPRTKGRKGHDSKSYTSSGTSSLGTFLIERASKNIELANYLYWYLKVELEDEVYGKKYQEVFSLFKEKMSKCIFHEKGQSISNESSSSTSRTMWDILQAQDIFLSGIMNCQKASRDFRGKKDNKELNLRETLKANKLHTIKNRWAVPLPSAPSIMVTGVKPESAKMFKSALYPALLEFYVQSSDDNNSSVVHHTQKTYKVIVKTGDDLRQDQLVIMMIKLMDRILKRGTLDLCLNPYSILATSSNSGLVEFVEGSIPISQILYNYNNSILQFFQSVAPCSGAKYGVNPQVMLRYIRSLAGYCVITYLIGVGDRHLDNIMLLPTGHFLHIDFGFIFGRDPKPLPPAFRLTREMVDGMGGQDSYEYRQFCSLACQAFNLLRKNAGLILNLLHLMKDAKIEDLSNNPSADADGIILKVEERFHLDLTDEQAESYFLGLINESLVALLPRLNEYFHQIATARR